MFGRGPRLSTMKKNKKGSFSGAKRDADMGDEDLKVVNV